MKTSAPWSGSWYLLVGCLALLAATVRADQNLAGNITVTGGTATGNLNVTGTIDSDGNALTFGTQGASYGAGLLYQDNTVDTFTFSTNRNPASWLWQHNASIPAMRLSSFHDLILYQADGTTAGITLQAASSSLKLGSIAALTGDSSGLITASGGLTVAGNFTNTNGSFTGGASGLSLNAGGTNQNITLSSSGTGDLVFNTNGLERARIKSSGNVGIGTTVPGTKLEIKGANVSGKGLLYVNGDDHGFIVTNSPATGVTGIAFAKNGTANWSTGMAASDASYYIAEGTSVGSNQRLAIAPGGNVGIGTTSPARPLHIYGTGDVRERIESTAGSGYSALELYNDVGFGGSFFQMGSSGVGYGGANSTNLINIQNASLALGTANNVRLSILGNGNVGIGTTAPGTVLAVARNINGNSGIGISNYDTGSASAGVLQFNNSTRDVAGFLAQLSAAFPGYGGNNSLNLVNVTAAPLAFGTTNTIRMLLDASGNLGLGTTSPAYTLDVNGTARIANYASIGGAPVYSRALVTYAPTGLNLAAEFTENAGVHAIQVRPNVSGINQITSDYWSGSTFLPLALSGRGATNDLVLATNGNVGIGTLGPGAKLEVYEPATGILTNTVLKLGAYNNTVGGGPFLDFNLRWTGGYPNWIGGRIGSVYETNSAGANRATLVFHTNDSNDATQGAAGATEKMRIRGDGNVGIGTTNPTHKLAVNGTIRAKEVIVDTGWADYVFDDSYRLAPLAEVEQHIRAEKHLPGIPSAAEVAAHGVSMGDMQAKLLSKVEELTLHLIRMEKENAALRERVQVLETASVTR